MLYLICTLKSAGLNVSQALGRRRDDRGQTAAEYLGIIVVVALIITAILGSGIGDTIASAIMTKISEISG